MARWCHWAVLGREACAGKGCVHYRVGRVANPSFTPCTFPRVGPQELINQDAATPPFKGKLARLVQERYKGMTFEENVCAQLLKPSVRRYTHLLSVTTLLSDANRLFALATSQGDKLMVTKFALDELAGRGQMVEAFTQLLGLPYVCVHSAPAWPQLATFSDCVTCIIRLQLHYHIPRSTAAYSRAGRGLATHRTGSRVSQAATKYGCV